MKIIKITLTALLALAAFNVVAQEAEEEDRWSGNIILGYLATTGNTENNTANFDFNVNYDINRWHHGLSGRYFSAAANDESTAENYRASWNSQYDFSEFNYGVGRLDYKKDRFSGYEYQRFATLAYGRRFIKSDRQELDGEIGAGWTQSEPFVGEEISEAILRLYGEYDLNITDTSTFSQTIEVSAGSSNTYTEAVSALRLSIIGSLGLTVSFTYQNNSDVPPETEKTDTITAIGLDYEF